MVSYFGPHFHVVLNDDICFWKKLQPYIYRLTLSMQPFFISLYKAFFGLCLEDSFSTLPFGFVTVAFTLQNSRKVL